MDEIRPSVDEFSELEVSFERSHSLWSVVSRFADDNSTDALCAVGSLIVCGIACSCVEDSWATCLIVAMVLAFSALVVIYGQKEDRADEFRDESAGTREAREDQ